MASFVEIYKGKSRDQIGLILKVEGLNWHKSYEARVLLKWCHTRTGYLLGIGIPWVLLHEYPRSTQKKKKLNTLSNKHEIASIFSLVLPSIKPLEHLSFILFWFQCWTLLLFSLLDLGLYSNHHLMVMDVFYYPWLLLNSHMFKKIWKKLSITIYKKYIFNKYVRRTRIISF